jgi:hypothetical protein
LEFLRERGCDEVQGKLFGSAMNAEEMTAFLKEANRLPKTFDMKTGPEKIKVEGSKRIH